MSTYAHLWILFTGKLKNNQCESCKLNEDEQNKKTKKKQPKKNQKKTRARQNSNVLTVLSDEKLNINKWKKIEEIYNAHLRSLAPIY